MGQGGALWAFTVLALAPLPAAGQSPLPSPAAAESTRTARQPELRLPEVRVRAETRCEVHPETADETAELWLDARGALEAAVRPRAEAPTFLIQEWRRTLGRDLALRWERRDTLRVTTLHPFEQPTPADLERTGYIQQRFGLTRFYGPDAGLLLSEGFLLRHCFSRVRGQGANTGLIGLAFTPLLTTNLPDVSGILWVDLALRELRHVEYTWINAPEEARGPAAGGRTEFVRLASGGWIVRRWNLRMPRWSARFGEGLDGYTDAGGEVLAVGDPLPARR